MNYQTYLLQQYSLAECTFLSRQKPAINYLLHQHYLKIYPCILKEIYLQMESETYRILHQLPLVGSDIDVTSISLQKSKTVLAIYNILQITKLHHGNKPRKYFESVYSYYKFYRLELLNLILYSVISRILP